MANIFVHVDVFLLSDYPRVKFSSGASMGLRYGPMRVGGGRENTGLNLPSACWVPGSHPFHNAWGLHAFLTALYESLT